MQAKTHLNNYEKKVFCDYCILLQNISLQGKKTKKKRLNQVQNKKTAF